MVFGVFVDFYGLWLSCFVLQDIPSQDAYTSVLVRLRSFGFVLRDTALLQVPWQLAVGGPQCIHWEFDSIPSKHLGHPKVCFMKVFRYIKPTKKHSFGCLGNIWKFKHSKESEKSLINAQ